MRISELARAADVPVATIKFYLREGLLPEGVADVGDPGAATARPTWSGSGWSGR